MRLCAASSSPREAVQVPSMGDKDPARIEMLQHIPKGEKSHTTTWLISVLLGERRQWAHDTEDICSEARWIPGLDRGRAGESSFFCQIPSGQTDTISFCVWSRQPSATSKHEGRLPYQGKVQACWLSTASFSSIFFFCSLPSSVFVALLLHLLTMVGFKPSSFFFLRQCYCACGIVVRDISRMFSKASWFPWAMHALNIRC